MLKPDASPAQLMRAGRIAILVILILSAFVGYFLTGLNAIFTYIQKYWSIAYPSIAAVFLAGFFYKKATGKGALYAITLGLLWAILVTVLDTMGLIPELSFLNRVIIDFAICVSIIWFFRDKSLNLPASSTIDRTLPDDMQAVLRNIPWYFSFRFWSLLLISIIIFLYVVFF